MAEAQDDTPSVFDEIESAATPHDAVAAAANRVSLRKLVELPLALGRGVLTIVMNGDAREAVRSAANIR